MRTESEKLQLVTICDQLKSLKHSRNNRFAFSKLKTDSERVLIAIKKLL